MNKAFSYFSDDDNFVSLSFVDSSPPLHIIYLLQDALFCEGDQF